MGDKELVILREKQLGKSLREDVELVDNLRVDLEKKIRAEAKTSGEKVAAGQLARKLVMAACGKVVLRWHPELKDYEPHSGARGEGYRTTAAEAGRAHTTISRWLDTVREVEKAGGAKAYWEMKLGELIDRWERGMLRQTYRETPPLPEGTYRIIYADPPWQYTTPQHSKEEQATVLHTHYPTMPTEEICSLDWGGRAWDDAVLFLWNTVPLLYDALKVVEAWGFTYKSEIIWDKILHNVGHWISVRHERLWICSRGSCLPDNKKLYDSVQSIERTEHSAKPQFFREMIDDLYPPPADYKKKRDRIELFPRGELPAWWDGWGNEYGI